MLRRRLVLLTSAALLLGGAAEAPAATQDLTLHSRSFTLGGFQTIRPKVGVRTPLRDGWVTRMDARLVDGRGRPVPIGRVMLHHLVFLRQGGATTCPGRKGEPFWGTGEERQPLLLPAGHGLRLRREDRWRMQVMLMSHSLRRQRVRVQYRVRVVTGRSMVPVRPFWLRANGCTPQPSYDVLGTGTPGDRHLRSHTWRLPVGGRIVAASAHLHAGAYGMRVTQPACRGRRLIQHDPRFGAPDDPVYRVRPVLHEPGPIATGHFLSPTGIPVARGERLRVTGEYDGERPRVAVMAITHVYVALRDAPRRPRCRALPRDGRIHWTRRGGRLEPPLQRLPIYGFDRRGRIVEVERPAGREVRSNRRELEVRVGSTFRPAVLSVRLGARVTWRFTRRKRHNVLLVDGPRLVTSGMTPPGGRYGRTFTTPGTYKLFCNLHPLSMTQVVTVRPKEPRR